MDFLILNPKALQLFMLIVTTARYKDGWNEHGLKINQAFVGKNYVASKLGLTHQEYRTAKATIEMTGAATFHPTNKGTIVTISNEVACIYTGMESNTQNDTPTDKPDATPRTREATKPQQTLNKPSTNPQHLTKKERKKEGEEGEKEPHTHRVREGKAEEPAEPGLLSLAQEVVDARCDWKLRVDHVALEIQKCPKELREEAVEQFAKDMANQVDPPDNPLAYFRKYMQNADRYSSQNSGKKINGGATDDADDAWRKKLKRGFQQG
jgi:hypothetical protein